MTEIVIIGAGLTGLATAYYLEKQGFTDYLIVEKEPEVGGLCRSITNNGFTFDYTGHLLHINDPILREFVQETIGFENLTAINRRSFIYSHETYTKYPYQMNLHGLPPRVISECIEGFVNRKKSTREPKSFDQWVLKHFGNGFAQHFFFPFQRKIFDYPIEKVSPAWTGRFFPQTSLQAMLTGALTNTNDSPVGYNSSFFYPNTGGISRWINSIASKLSRPIHTGIGVEQVNLHNKTVRLSNGHSEPFKQLVTTMPLDTLLGCLHEPAALTLKRAQRHLVCNSVTNFNLGVARPDLSDKHWIYLPEAQYPFYRVGFPHNFSQALVPTGCSSLYGEFSHVKRDQAWVADTLSQARKQTQQLLKIAPSDIVCEKIIHISHAYVLYTFWRQKNLATLLATLAQENVHSIGRYGAWKYSSMQEAVLDGKAIADQLTRTSRNQEHTP